MNTIHLALTVAILTSLAFGAASESSEPYQIQSEFGDSISCDYVSQGIFVVWWDNKNDLSQEAQVLLDSLNGYRETILTTMDMQDPPNPQDGYFFNVYLHEQGDVFPDEWACGLRTDNFGYPYMIFPIFTLGDWVTLSHEAFHVFQYNSDAPGFSMQHSDVFWFWEASANWFSAITYPDHPNTYVQALSLVRVPQVAMWLGWDNFPPYYPDNWQRQVHQYAMCLFLYYLTEEEGIPYSLVYGGFYNEEGEPPQDLNPQEYLFQSPHAGDLREHFMNWAAHITNDFDFILPNQIATAEYHWNTYADPADNNQFTQVFDNNSTDVWYTPPDSLATTAWSFNTYKVRNSSEVQYSFVLQGNENGSMGDPACFRGRIVVQNTIAETRFYDLEMESNVYGSLTVDAAPSDTALYFIVGSVPETFNGSQQVFSYSISVDPSGSSVDPQAGGSGRVFMENCSPNPFSTQTAIELHIPSQGHVSLEIYDLSGRLVRTILNREVAPGAHGFSWNGTDDSGNILPSGMYVVQLQHSGDRLSQRLTILR